MRRGSLVPGQVRRRLEATKFHYVSTQSHTRIGNTPARTRRRGFGGKNDEVLTAITLHTLIISRVAEIRRLDGVGLAAEGEGQCYAVGVRASCPIIIWVKMRKAG